MVTMSWQPSDAHGNSSSGSMAVTATSRQDSDAVFMGGSKQCLLARPLRTYSLYADTFIAGGQGNGSAGISLFFFTSVDCTGPVIATRVSTFNDGVDAWNPILGAAIAPADATSMLVRLVVTKPFRDASFTARFDSVGVYAH